VLSAWVFCFFFTVESNGSVTARICEEHEIMKRKKLARALLIEV
jgi:hypothetical protein